MYVYMGNLYRYMRITVTCSSLMLPNMLRFSVMVSVVEEKVNSSTDSPAGAASSIEATGARLEMIRCAIAEMIKVFVEAALVHLKGACICQNALPCTL